jgi:PAS domain S-box-containing protein
MEENGRAGWGERRKNRQLRRRLYEEAFLLEDENRFLEKVCEIVAHGLEGMAAFVCETGRPEGEPSIRAACAPDGFTSHSIASICRERACRPCPSGGGEAVWIAPDADAAPWGRLGVRHLFSAPFSTAGGLGYLTIVVSHDVDNGEHYRDEVEDIALYVGVALDGMRYRARHKEADTRLSLMLDAIPAYFYQAVIEDGVLSDTYHSHHCVDLTGYTSEEYAADEKLWYEMIAEEDREAALAWLGSTESFATGRSLEHRIRTRDGSIKWVQNVSSVVVDADGRVIRNGVIFDVTGRREREEERKNLLERLNERLKELRTLYGVAKILASANRTRESILGDVVQRIPFGWRHHDFAVARLVVGDESWTSGDYRPTPWRMQAPVETAGGKELVVEVCYLHEAPPADEGPFTVEERKLINAVAQMVAGFLERVEIKRRRESALRQAEESNRLKDNFVGMVSHDLRSPVTVIIGLLKTLSGGGGESLSARAQGMATRLVASAEALLKRIDDILSLNRIQQGRIKPQKKFLDAAGIVRAAVGDLEEMARTKAIDIVYEIPEQVSLWADPTLMVELIQNVVSNAVKFTPAGGRVVIGSPPNDPSSLVIRDSGVGLPLNELREALDRGQVFTRNGTAGEKGTGYGMVLCDEIMRVHGGRMEVGNHPDGGGVVTLRFPDRKPKVLVIDDEPSIVRMIEGHFRRGDAVDVSGAGSGAEGWALIQSLRPDVVLLDLRMRDMDGFEILRRVRELDRPEQVLPQIIVITGYDSPETRKRVFALGASDYLVKPFGSDELFMLLGRHVAPRHMAL